MMPAIFSSFVLKLCFSQSRVDLLAYFTLRKRFGLDFSFSCRKFFRLIGSVFRGFVNETHVRSSAFGTMFENSMFIDWKRVLCNSCPDRGAFKFRSCGLLFVS